MSKLFGKIAGFFSNRTLVGVDKAGNSSIDLLIKQYWKYDETSVIGHIQLTKFSLFGLLVKEKRWVVFKGEDDPTSIPVEWICWLNGQRKKAPTPEEMMELEARRERVRQNVARQVMGPDLKSFIRQVPTGSEGAQDVEGLPTRDTLRSSEPVGSGHTFRPGTWQPPT
uniref:NADH dehydrogenase [ubiquinone] 1 alpha subcomplex subunit 12 n=1 Tax=Cucumis melo TaxID=3656 RepID=A0A9I9DYX4_CUCME